jgi:hypothetical protein
MSEFNTQEGNRVSSLREMAEHHVDWLLAVMREPMIQEFLHGFKHGMEAAQSGEDIDAPEYYSEFKKSAK